MSIKITKEGFKVLEWVYDEEKGEGEYVEQPPKATYIRNLRDACTIEDGTTLRDIFNAVERDGPLMQFLGDYSWCDVVAFHKEAKKPCDKPTDLSRLELMKYIETGEETGESLDLSGVGPPDKHCVEAGITTPEIHYGISLSPVNELASLPVVINSKAIIRKDFEEIGQSTVCFSLLEVLSEIYYEISFHGSPSDRDNIAADLDGMMEELKKEVQCEHEE